MEKNWSYKIPDGPHAGTTLWSGRYCAVAAFVFRRIDGIWSVLANLRGSGTPDYQGCWNAVCGFLEANETAQQGCSREIFEETGYEIKPEKFLQVYTQTDPETSNNGNVTLRHIAIFFEHELGTPKNPEGGEEHEVDAIKWIPIDQIHMYKWAFNHELTLKILFNDYIVPLCSSRPLSKGEFFMLSQTEWLNNNPMVKYLLKNKILNTFEINDLYRQSYR